MNQFLLIYAVTILCFAALWLIRDWQFAKERNLLLDRLMAKNLPEFNHEVRKKEILKKTVAPKPCPTDEELAEWERKHQSQVAENNAAAQAAVEALKRKMASEQAPVEAVHGS